MTIVIRPTWQGDEHQNRLLQEAINAASTARRTEDVAWRKIKAARDAGIPDTVLCRRVEVSRATLNRKLGSRSDHASTQQRGADGPPDRPDVPATDRHDEPVRGGGQGGTPSGL